MEKEMNKLIRNVGCESGSIWLKDEDDDSILVPYVFCGPKSHSLMDITISIDNGICGYCVRNNEKMITNNMKDNEYWDKNVDNFTSYVTRNILCVPINIGGETIGCLELLNKDGDFKENDVEMAKAVIDEVLEEI